MIKYEHLSLDSLKHKPPGHIDTAKVMEHEIEGVVAEYWSMKGPCGKTVTASKQHYDVLLPLGGTANLKTKGTASNLRAKQIVKIPFGEPYELTVKKGQDFYCLLIREQLTEADLAGISKEPGKHAELYLKAFSECTVYTEDIKSPKTVNRMILPEWIVPRVCMGTVETDGPDEVAAHRHPMLEQMFLGMKGCRCTVTADDESVLLTENMLLHIPLGSTHSVRVDAGDKLAYIWLDFFKTLADQDYISEQHKMDGEP